MFQNDVLYMCDIRKLVVRLAKYPTFSLRLVIPTFALDLPPMADSPAAVDTAGVGVRSGADLFGSPGPGINVDEGSAEDPTPTVGQLSRHNARVAAVRNCGELARCALSCE